MKFTMNKHSLFTETQNNNY